MLARPWLVSASIASPSTSPSSASEDDEKALEIEEKGDVLRVASFNVLADGLAQHGGFKYLAADRVELAWETRRELVVREMADAEADVLCMAECNHFDAFWEPALRDRFSMDALFSPKDESPAVQFGAPPDGCCIAWRPAEMECLASHRYGSDPVQAIAVLRHTGNATIGTLLVSMVHLKSKPGHEQRRLSQTERALERIESVCTQHKGLDRVVLCGDLNAEPTEPCVRTLRKTFTSTYPDSVWSTFKVREAAVKRKIDYIMCRGAGVSPLRCWAPPVDVDEQRGLPSARYGSDHVCLAAKLSFT